MDKSRKGPLLIILAMAIFGFAGIYVRFLQNTFGFSILFLVFMNFLIPGVFLVAYFWWRDRSIFNHKGLLWFLILFTIFDILNIYSYWQAFALTTISNAVLTHYTAPLFVALLAPFLIKEKVNKRIALALSLSVVGLVLLTYGDYSFKSQDFIGILFGTASGLFYALIIICIRYMHRKISAYTMRIYECGIALILLTPFLLVGSNTPLLLTSFSLASIIGFAFLMGVIAVTLHWSGIKHVTSHQAGVLGYAELIFAAVFAAFFFLEIPQPLDIIGGLLIVGGGLLVIKN